jgi:hypothetical protein
VLYNDAEWVGKELNWQPSLVDEAKKLIAGLAEAGITSDTAPENPNP